MGTIFGLLLSYLISLLSTSVLSTLLFLDTGWSIAKKNLKVGKKIYLKDLIAAFVDKLAQPKLFWLQFVPYVNLLINSICCISMKWKDKRHKLDSIKYDLNYLEEYIIEQTQNDKELKSEYLTHFSKKPEDVMEKDDKFKNLGTSEYTLSEVLSLDVNALTGVVDKKDVAVVNYGTKEELSELYPEFFEQKWSLDKKYRVVAGRPMDPVELYNFFINTRFDLYKTLYDTEKDLDQAIKKVLNGFDKPNKK